MVRDRCIFSFSPPREKSFVGGESSLISVRMGKLMSLFFTDDSKYSSPSVEGKKETTLVLR